MSRVYAAVQWSDEADWRVIDLFPTIAEAAAGCTNAGDYVLAVQGTICDLTEEEEQELRKAQEALSQHG